MIEQNVFLSFSDPNGNVQLLNASNSDNSYPIYYELETQELEFNNRTHLKKIADKIVVFTTQGMDSILEANINNDGYKPIPMSLNNRVNIGKDINLEGYFFTFKWSGNTATAQPIFGGFNLEDITDVGMSEQ